jgi:hypothetical protein
MPSNGTCAVRRSGCNCGNAHERIVHRAEDVTVGIRAEPLRVEPPSAARPPSRPRPSSLCRGRSLLRVPWDPSRSETVCPRKRCVLGASWLEAAGGRDEGPDPS